MCRNIHNEKYANQWRVQIVCADKQTGLCVELHSRWTYFNKNKSTTRVQCQLNIQGQIYDWIFGYNSARSASYPDGKSRKNTARLRMGWPSGEIKEIKKDETMFNTCYHTIDKNGILLTRWMDNNLVFMVSTCHQIGTNRNVNRKKPTRLNQVNKNHVEKVWGTNKGVKTIHIPSMV